MLLDLPEENDEEDDEVYELSEDGGGVMLLGFLHLVVDQSLEVNMRVVEDVGVGVQHNLCNTYMEAFFLFFSNFGREIYELD